MSRVSLCCALLVLIAASAALAGDAPRKKAKNVPPAAQAKGAPAAAKPQPAQADLPPAKRLVYPVKNLPAIDLAKTVNEFLRDEAAAQPGGRERVGRMVVIVPEQITNSLLVSGSADDLDRLAEVVEQLDVAPRMVCIQVLMAEVNLDEDFQKSGGRLMGQLSGQSLDGLIAELKQHGQIRLLAQPAVTTLDNQPAFIQVGHRVPRTTGTAVTPKGTANSVTLEDVGLTLGVTPRVNADGLVTMEIDVDESHLGPAEEGAVIFSSPEGEETRSPEIQTSKLQTTVAAASGETIALGGLVSRRETKPPAWQGVLVFLTPHVLGQKHAD